MRQKAIGDENILLVVVSKSPEISPGDFLILLAVLRGYKTIVSR